MTVFFEQLRKVLPEGMEIPKELEMLYGYAEPTANSPSSRI